MVQLSKALLFTMLTAIAVYLSGILSIALGIGSEGISMIWLPSGIGLLAGLLWGKPTYLGTFLGVAIIQFLGWLLPSFPNLQPYTQALPYALLLASFATFEVVFNRYWIHHQLSEFNFNSIKHILIYLGITALGCMANASLSVTSLTLLKLTSQQAATSTFITFWLGNWCGTLLVTPIGLAIFRYNRDKHRVEKLSTLNSGFPIITIGLSLTLMASFMSYKIETKARFEKFQRNSYVVFSEIEHALNLSLSDVNSLATMHYKVDISRNEFNHFAIPILTRNPLITKIGWVPRVLAKDKHAFEEQAVRDGFLNFHIFDIDSQQNPIPANPKEDYYPIYNTATLKGNVLNYGFNIGSSPARFEAVKLAISSGIPIATQKIKLVMDRLNQVAFNVYFPIYRGAIEEDASLKNENNIRGLISTSYSLNNFFDVNRDFINQNQLIVYIEDATNPHHNEPLVASDEDFQWNNTNHPFHVQNTINFAGRTWILNAIPKNERLLALPPSISLIVFGIGLIFTSLIAGYMLNKRKNEHLLLANEQRLSEQNRSLAALTSVYHGDNLAVSFEYLTTVAAHTLQVAQTSIWLFNEDQTKLSLNILYELATNSFKSQGELSKTDYPIYFANVIAKKIIDAHDAMTDQRTQELSNIYLPQHHVASMLDIPIIAGDKVVGVFCIEQKDQARTWTTDEKTYAESLRNIIALTLEINARREAQQALERSNLALEDKVNIRTQDLASINQQLKDEIREHQRAEEQLKIFRRFADSATQGLGIARLDRTLLYTNTAMQKLIHAKPLESDEQVDFLEYFGPSSQQRLTNEVIPTIFEKGEWSGETMLELADNTQIPVYTSAFLITNEEGKPAYFATINNDISAKKEVERQLVAAKNSAEAADRAKSMFIASMSHELRTPLNSIIGFTGVILQGISGSINDRQKDQLQRVLGSAKHLLQLITDVIDISKIEAGYIDTYLEWFSLTDVIKEAIASVQQQREEKSLTLSVNLDDSIQLYSDKKRTMQVVLNLLSNAVKYSEQGGITVNSYTKKDKAHIEVIDTGIGIPETAQERLFKPFERIDSHLKIRNAGTGLGLYLTRKITHDFLHGEVRMSSIVGVGSTFTIELPLQVKEAASLEGNKDAANRIGH